MSSSHRSLTLTFIVLPLLVSAILIVFYVFWPILDGYFSASPESFSEPPGVGSEKVDSEQTASEDIAPKGGHGLALPGVALQDLDANQQKVKDALPENKQHEYHSLNVRYPMIALVIKKYHPVEFKK